MVLIIEWGFALYYQYKEIKLWNILYLKEIYIIKYLNGKKSNKYAMLIKEVRRIGKSTIAKEFAKNEFKSYIIIDFSHTSKDIILFDDTYDLDFFLSSITRINRCKSL